MFLLTMCFQGQIELNNAAYKRDVLIRCSAEVFGTVQTINGTFSTGI